ncbi:O-FucT domain protein, putative [Rhizoctonia solani AG-3 Rhs1AP]|uniref:O-FucT domain protein, putative n=2 Tax=Rhizoctonia solani AG-3 TaxID=1086053 RepID=X8JLD8_9AGAM|nr:O-FucT domain protein, putative [Rhizoctonia solani AG-3 Rhs1AP]KEP46875.1 putative O-FucT domain protein [Rhizoctonia solani 123E]
MSGPMRLTTHRRSGSHISVYSDNFELMQPRPPSLAARIRNYTRSLQRHLRWRARNILVALGVFVLVVYYLSNYSSEEIPVPPPKDEVIPGPRDFEDYKERLQKMPQHNPDLPPPAGRNGRYVRFRNQVYGLGWNNILQEILLNTHVAHKAGRAYVHISFHAAAHPAMGSGSQAPWIPLNAFMDAPTAGGPWPAGDKSPRAVSEEWYDTICPPEARVTLDTAEVGGHVKDLDAKTLIDFWSQKLLDMDDRCVEINGKEQVFHYYLTGSTRVLTAFEEFSKSATLQMFKWSDLVVGAVKRNFELISPIKQRNSRPLVFYPEGKIDGLLAMHVRRGDYLEQCTHFANWSSTYTSWALLPQLPDQFTIPEGCGGGKATPEAVAIYRRVCWPSNAHVVERARLMRKLHPKLDRIYILTNGKPDYLAQLKADLRADGWEKLSTSQDMGLNWQEMWVSQSIDMSIAQRAEVFVGNGFSTLSSNVAMLRLSSGFSFDSIRFW